MIRWGLCCIFREAPIRFRRATAKYLSQLPPKERLCYLSDICMHNAESLFKALKFCRDNGIGAFRINSQIQPLKTHPQRGYAIEALPRSDEIVDTFKRCGTYCRQNDIRTSFHPDQFILLSSPNPDVTRRSIADLQYQAMQLIGPITFTQDEIDFAQKINDAFPGTNSDYVDDAIEYYKPPPEIVAVLDEYRDQPLWGGNFPALDEAIIATGSTDVGDLSQIVPVSMVGTTCFPSGCPGHSWGNVAASGMSIGHKGMMHAAKIMAVTAVELYSAPGHLVKIRQEFEQKTGGKPYGSPIAKDAKPPRYEPDD